MRTTPRILDQISAEKTKVGERLARLDADRATVTAQLTDLETAERVLTRVSKTPPARRTRSATAAEAKAPTASRGRRRTSRATASEAAGREIRSPANLIKHPLKPGDNMRRSFGNIRPPPSHLSCWPRSPR